MQPINQHFADVVAFHIKYGLVFTHAPKLLDHDTAAYRHAFLEEELRELMHARRAIRFPDYVDSLVDLVYVAMGSAYFMGIDWRRQPEFKDVYALHLGFGHVTAGKPDFDFGHGACEWLRRLRQGVTGFADYHSWSDLLMAERQLAEVVFSCYQLALLCHAPWDELWDEVQRANMRKERALIVSDSKRGTTLDVVKPARWTGPDIGGVLRRHGWEGKE